MGAKTSAEMLKAVRLHKGGCTVPEAARKAGVWEGSLYAKLRDERKKNIVTDQQLNNAKIDLGQESEK